MQGGWGNHPDKKMNLLTFFHSVRAPQPGFPRPPGIPGKPGLPPQPFGKGGQKNSSGYIFFSSFKKGVI
jgi:hypothetical protein